MIPWEFLWDGRCRPQETMSRDLELFETVKSDNNQGFLRIYNWTEPSVTIGFHQKTFAFHDPGLALPVLSRPTGGGAVLHKDDITFSMGFRSEGLLPSGIPECSARISGIFALALHQSGLEVQAAGGKHSFSDICFAMPSPVELMLGGSKLMGLALLRKGKLLLAQGVIPLTIDADLSERVFGSRLRLTGVLDQKKDFSIKDFVQKLREILLSELGVFLSDRHEDDAQRHDADEGEVKPG